MKMNRSALTRGVWTLGQLPSDKTTQGMIVPRVDYFPMFSQQENKEACSKLLGSLLNVCLELQDSSNDTSNAFETASCI